jgi:hypothetical protein
MPSGSCLGSCAGSEPPNSLAEGPAPHWRVEPSWFGRSGKPGRGYCNLTWQALKLRNPEPTGHVTGHSLHRASGAWQHPASVPARELAGKERKRAGICESKYLTPNAIVPEVWERGNSFVGLFLAFSRTSASFESAKSDPKGRAIFVQLTWRGEHLYLYQRPRVYQALFIGRFFGNIVS